MHRISQNRNRATWSLNSSFFPKVEAPGRNARRWRRNSLQFLRFKFLFPIIKSCCIQLFLVKELADHLNFHTFTFAFAAITYILLDIVINRDR
uniref:Uncharacterized protein n=1 Tax=Cucumis sativus TaxID=3659 RepID=A0A0A0LKJ1_CUCSA